MIRLEDQEFESFVLSGASDIAVPLEVFRDAAGNVTITSYRFCLDVAKEFEMLFEKDPFAPEAVHFLREHLTPLVSKFGFVLDRKASELIYEWERSEPYEDLSAERAVLLTATPEEGFSSLLSFTPDPDPANPLSFCAAVIEDGRVVSCAQINDLPTDDGFPEVNAETALPYRRMGYAASSVRVLADALIKRGMTVRYACRSKNKGSAGTAAAAGFVRHGERRSFVCYHV